jgi:hypothetical protein
MDTPSLLAAELGDDPVAAEVDLGGDDRLVVTPARTLVYRADGLLRDETVEEFPHDVDRLGVAEGRRKATVTATTVDGEVELTVPTDRLDDVLTPLLGGVLAAAGVTDADEEVHAVYRFSELTLVVTDQRVVKHVGSALWDGEHESYPFERVTDLDAEEGRVGTGIVLTVDGRPRRIKAPSDRADAVRRTLGEALLAYHGVDSLTALRARTGDDGDGESESADDGEASPEEERTERTVEPLLDDGSASAASTAEGEAANAAAEPREAERPPADAGSADADVLERLDRLEAAVERQGDRIERQRETIETLVEELRQGR